MSNTTKHNGKPLVRCAIYKRKSTEEGLEQEFNSLDAQRDSAEAYIAAQKHEGWTCLPDRYDDGGFTGGNMDRPALLRLMKDIEAGSVDCVVVYKVDRLSRSLMDFARMMEVFEKHSISFVSVTQQFNTTHSMGRLTLNILLSFAQFEREIISERTRDKIAAARRKGKWSGGKPVLGYDLLSNPSGAKLVVNEDEARQVRQIFQLYLKHQGLIPTVAELNRRGWLTKRWDSRNGTSCGGKPFDKTTLFKVLTNVVYLGKVRYRDEVHPGEQARIIDDQLWQKVRSMLAHNGRTGGSGQRNKHGALLKGILRCSCCRCSMGHSYTSKGSKRYRYYICLNAQKRGWNACPVGSIPAGEIERFVVEQIRGIGSDRQVLAETLRHAWGQRQRELQALKNEQQAIERALKRHNTELAKIAADPRRTNQLADLQDRIRQAEQRLTAIREQIVAISADMIDDEDVRTALASFDPVWETLSPREQARLVRLLVERVEYDGEKQTVSVTLRPSGIKALAQEQEHQLAEVAA